MFGKVRSCAIYGLDSIDINVEADVHDGLPTFTMIGYLSSSVRETSERVRTALKNSGYYLPPKRITVNLSPANIRKEGSSYDLAVAISLLHALEVIPYETTRDMVVLGELGLDGTVNKIPGILPMVHHCYKHGIRKCMVPYDNLKEASIIHNLEVIGVHDLNEAITYLQEFVQNPNYYQVNNDVNETNVTYTSDFAEIKGQETIKRGLEIAAAGFHNVLMSGSQGSGKSILAKSLPSILPKMTFEECLDVTKIHSICGLISDDTGLIRHRPFRTPHHTISEHALAGGGNNPKPGEISLAHNGVLFLDELPEFRRNVLEIMRQPLEDGQITISRLNARCVFPAKFMLVAAMNPCPCGYYPDLSRCTCSLLQVQRYQSKISGPLLDRIDISMHVKPVEYKDMIGDFKAEASTSIRERVEEARQIQAERYKDEGIYFNSELNNKQIKMYIRLGNKEEELLNTAFEQRNLSARATYKILKVARTIADLNHSKDIKETHLMEAIYYHNQEVDIHEI